MVGGGGEKKTLRIAAKQASISHCAFNPSMETLEHKLSVLKKHCEAVNRDFDEIKIGISVNRARWTPFLYQPLSRLWQYC